MTMFFPQEIERHMRTAAEIARRNVLAFCKRYDLDIDEIDELVRRQFPMPCVVLFVSTVPAGLAGSVSDLDLILIPDSDPIEDSSSSMMFYRGRRIGIKVVTRAGLSQAIDEVQAYSKDHLIGRCSDIHRSHPLRGPKWADFTRIVNGISFAAGSPYLRFLPAVSYYATARAVAAYLQQHLAAQLAERGGALGAAFAYRMTAVLWAMDALMSSCGQVLANSKWTLQRWARFVSVEAREDIAEARQLISSVWSAVSEQHANAAARFDRLHATMERMISVDGATYQRRLQIPGKAVQSEFLLGALVVKHGVQVAAVPARLIDYLRSDRENQQVHELSATQAAAAWKLWSIGLLETADRALEH